MELWWHTLARSLALLYLPHTTTQPNVAADPRRVLSVWLQPRVWLKGFTASREELRPKSPKAPYL